MGDNAALHSSWKTTSDLVSNQRARYPAYSGAESLGLENMFTLDRVYSCDLGYKYATMLSAFSPSSFPGLNTHTLFHHELIESRTQSSCS